MFPNITNPFVKLTMLGRPIMFLYKTDKYVYFQDKERRNIIYKQSLITADVEILDVGGKCDEKTGKKTTGAGGQKDRNP